MPTEAARVRVCAPVKLFCERIATIDDLWGPQDILFHSMARTRMS
jgi:hypothetical protein